jgi:hypothetical protein
VAAHWTCAVSITITPGNHLQLRDALNTALAELKDRGLIARAVWQLTEHAEEEDTRMDRGV